MIRSSGADDAKRESTADTECEARERGNIAPGQGVIGVLPILALDGPEFAAVGFGDYIDALIGGGQFELPRHRQRHFLVQPDMFQFARILGLKLEERFDEFLQPIALLLAGQVAQPGPEILPR